MTQCDRALIQNGEPLIINDYSDAGALRANARWAIMQPNVIGIIKPVLYRNPAMQNAPFFEQTFHGELIRRALTPYLDGLSPEIDNIQLPTSLIQQKAKPTMSFGQCNFMWPLYQNGPPDFDSPRELDCFFAGAMYYNRISSTLHRWQCIKTLCGYGGKSHDLKLDVTGQRFCSVPEHAARMRKARTGISPWGYGERNFRDYESMLCGAVLIKPDTDWSVSWPDIYTPEHYVKCCPDFSDLVDVIRCVRDNWADYRDMREQNWELLNRTRQLAAVADHFAELFNYYGSLL